MKHHADRFLRLRGSRYSYYRRVPAAVGHLDNRAPFVRQALRTSDLAVARRARDILEAADDARWGALVAETAIDDANARHVAAVKLAMAHGYGYRTADDLARNATWGELSSRLEVVMPGNTPPRVVEAVLGTADEPKAKFDDALKIYVEEIHKAQLARKSPQQLRKWRVIPERAIRTFKDVVGDKALEEITRADAVAFYRHWLGKISPDDPKAPRWSASSGNRQIGELRKLFRGYFDHVHDDPDRPNPFRGLSFKEDDEKKRPAFSDSWIQEKFLCGSHLASLNRQARAILLAMVETGARPSELCNLQAEDIHVDAEVPYVSIRERMDPEMPRELKSKSSRRYIPLVGVALAVFQAFPKGFDRYWESEESFSATANKYLSENHLRESSKHSIYSLRHSFEDRLIRAGFDVELRIALFGHKSQRPVYGDAGGLAWKADQLSKIALPFDDAVLS